jgi:S1-C subfamily serine protease
MIPSHGTSQSRSQIRAIVNYCERFMRRLWLLSFCLLLTTANGCDALTDMSSMTKEASPTPSASEPSGDALAGGTPPALATSNSPGDNSYVAGQPLTPGSSPAVPTPGVGASNNNVLRYKFIPDRTESYNVDIAIKGSSSRKIFGLSNFTANEADGVTVNQPIVEGSGTAWVVSADGYLITCAHVVAGARQISVTINNQTYPATVVTSDDYLDLALLKIAANNLAPLSLAADGSFEQGQEVRSVGFPLSSVLGESIKINRGTIAGFVNLTGRDLVQIDVPINPGNSGGPVVDLYGNVIGVASEKLAGAEISSVGFCVPAAVVRNWATPHVRSLSTGAKSQEMSGTALSKKVSPSVALVKATSGGANPNAKTFLVDGSGFYTVSDSNRVLSGLNTIHDEGALLLDDCGAVVEMRDCHQLPFLLGPLATLAIPELSSNGSPQWNVTEEIQIAASSEQEAEQNPLEAMLSRRYRYGFGGRPMQRVVTLVSAIRVEHYRVLSTEGNIVTIEKRWEIKSEPVPGVGFNLGCDGSGTWKFDRNLGMMLQFNGDANYNLSNAAGQLSLPMSITVTRNTEQFEKSMADLRAKGPATSPIASSDSSSTPNRFSPTGRGVGGDIADPELQETISELSGTSDKTTRLAALNKLSKFSINSTNRPAVIQALAGNLLHSDPEVKSKSLEALADWDTATMVSHVLDLLEDDNSKVVISAIEYLGSASDVDAADELAEIAREKPQYRQAAMDALAEIGPGTEKTVIELLKNKDLDIRRAACKVLGKIGGQESIGLLKKLAASSNAAADDAKAALSELGVPY